MSLAVELKSTEYGWIIVNVKRSEVPSSVVDKFEDVENPFSKYSDLLEYIKTNGYKTYIHQYTASSPPKIYQIVHEKSPSREQMRAIEKCFIGSGYTKWGNFYDYASAYDIPYSYSNFPFIEKFELDHVGGFQMSSCRINFNVIEKYQKYEYFGTLYYKGKQDYENFEKDFRDRALKIIVSESDFGIPYECRIESLEFKKERSNIIVKFVGKAVRV